jgi:lipocalin
VGDAILFTTSELLAEAQRRGYDTDKLIWVRQDK